MKVEIRKDEVFEVKWLHKLFGKDGAEINKHEFKGADLPPVALYYTECIITPADADMGNSWGTAECINDNFCKLPSRIRLLLAIRWTGHIYETSTLTIWFMRLRARCLI